MKRLLLGAVLVAACGGAGAKPAEPSVKSADPPAKTAGAPSARSDQEPANATSPPPSPEEVARLAQHEKLYIDGCTAAREGIGPYCQCMWTETVAIVGRQKMSSAAITLDDFTAARPRAAAVCRPRIPDDVIKKTFVDACIAKREGLERYCECSWKELRKDLAAADIADDEHVTKNPTFIAANAKLPKSCGPLIPERYVKEGFFKGCVQNPKLEKFCACAWDELRKMASPAEIQADVVDQEKLQSRLSVACGKYRPKQ